MSESNVQFHDLVDYLLDEAKQERKGPNKPKHSTSSSENEEPHRGASSDEGNKSSRDGGGRRRRRRSRSGGNRGDGDKNTKTSDT